MQHSTIATLWTLSALACMLYKFSLPGISLAAANLYNLPKDLTAQSFDNNRTVLPKIFAKLNRLCVSEITPVEQ